MAKVAVGKQPVFYPVPAVLVGANVAGKPNFMTAAWAGIVNSEPLMLGVGIRHSRYTLLGVIENKVFSINVASIDQMKEVDYCGITPGVKIDKAAVCEFKVYYGKLGKAPLIEQCPVNLECSVHQTVDLGSHVLVIGKIEEVYVTDTCLTDGKPDPEKINPLIYLSGGAQQYRAMGKYLGKGHSVGAELRK